MICGKLDLKNDKNVAINEFTKIVDSTKKISNDEELYAMSQNKSINEYEFERDS